MALAVKNLPANAGDVRDTGSIPASGRSPGGGHSNSLQYSCLENPMDRGAWQAVAHRVSQSQTRLKQFSMHAYTHTGLEWGKGGKRTLLNHWVNSDLLNSLLLNRCNYLTLRAQVSSVQSLSFVRLYNPMDCSMPGFLVHHQILELAQTHIHRVGDALYPSHPLSSPSLPAFNLSQHQGLSQ